MQPDSWQTKLLGHSGTVCMLRKYARDRFPLSGHPAAPLPHCPIT